MNPPGLLASWSRTRADLERARALLPAADLARVDEWLEHNELGLALEELEALGDQHAAPDPFWAALLTAAERMGLTAAADRIRQRLPTWNFFLFVPNVLARAGAVHEGGTLTLPAPVARDLGLPERVAWALDGDPHLVSAHPRFDLARVLRAGGVTSPVIDQLLAEHAARREASNTEFLGIQAHGLRLVRDAMAATGRFGPGDLAPTLDAAIDRHGLQAHRERLHAACLRAVAIRPGARGPVPLGASRIGGTPDLPPGASWPRHGDDLLRFVAQLDLAALPPAHTLPLPREGHLVLFHGPRFDPWADGFVGYLPPDPLARAVPPPGADWVDDGDGPYDEASVVFAPVLSLPYGGLLHDALEPSLSPVRRELHAYADSVLGGHMYLLHHDLLCEMAFGAHGHPDVWHETTIGIEDVGAPPRRAAHRWLTPERREQLAREMVDWVCLLDLAPQDDLGLHLMGRLQFVVPRADLAELRFDRLQCRLV